MLVLVTSGLAESLTSPAGSPVRFPQAVEEAKLAAAAKQKAALEARMAAMTEEELLNMQMTEKLTTDLETCRGSLTLATESLSATETEIAMIQDGLKEERTAEINKIATLEVVVKSFSGMLAAVETYDEQCTQLKTEVAQLVTMENQRRMDTHGISGRIKQELDEAQARLKKQTDLMHNMHRDLKKMYTEYHTAEKQQETQLAVVSSEVAAKKLNLDLAQQRLALLRSEMSKLQERIEDTRFIEAKKQRVATTTAQVEEIKGKMALDDQAIVACKKRETQIVEEEQLSEAKMEARLRAYDADKDSLRSLVALQEAFLNGELAALENEEDSSDPTKAKLLESTRVLVQERATASKNRMDEIEQAERTYTADYNAAHDRRQAQLRQKRAERKALEAAHSERQRYLNEKMSQLEIEEKQLAAAARTIQDHKDCIKMLQAEMELSQTATNERQSELTTAMNLKKAFTTQLESLKTANKLNLARLRVQIDSESRVHSEQQSYVESLMGRMKLESTAVVEEDGTESEDAAAAAPPQGKHGLALAHQNEAAMTAWVEELNAQRTEAESSLVGARTALVTAEKRAQNMLAAAEEQRITQQHEVSKLQQYELSLETKLATVSPRASPATPSKVQFHLPNNALGAISEATPYKGSVKLLHTSEKFAQPHSPTTVDPIASGFGLTEEEDHPMYNPDLKPDIEATSEKRTSIRSRISGYVPAIGQRLIFADASEYP